MKEYQKLSSKNKMAYDKEKRYETLNEVKLIKHIHKESKRFQGKSHMRKEVPLS